MLGNRSTQISFRVGAEDALLIGRAIDWSANDLMDLSVIKARIRTLRNGKPTNAMLLETSASDLPTGNLEGMYETRLRTSPMRKAVEKALNAPKGEWVRPNVERRERRL